MNIEQTRQPLRLASHVPGDIYSSPEMFAREKERIFLKDWLCVARLEEVGNLGDYITLRIMDEPILIARDMDGVVHAFANVCMHRGVEIAFGQGNAKAFQCPYHAWTYDLKGRLRGAPFMSESVGFENASCNLKEVKLGLWAGWIFVSLNPESEPFETYISEFADDIGFLKMENCVLGSKLVVDLECNWKLVVENLMDVYHAQTLHAKSFGKHRGSPDKYPFNLRKYGGTCTTYEAAPMTPDGKTRFRRMPAIAEKADNFAVSAHLGPNMQVIARSDNIHPLVMWPVTPTTSRTIVYNLFPAEFAAAPDFKERVQVYHDYLAFVLSEDRDMVASLQRAMASSLFVPGRMSFLEKGIHHVLNAYLDRMFA
jgi:Rieske 2Fe-2S family protein